MIKNKVLFEEKIDDKDFMLFVDPDASLTACYEFTSRFRDYCIKKLNEVYEAEKNADKKIEGIKE